MRILIYGAGVLGSLYAAWLQDSGQDVTVLARGTRATELREQGIRLEHGATGMPMAVGVKVIESLAPNDRYDWILVLMRRNQVAAILPALAANSTPNVAFLTNNAAGAEEYIRALGRDRVVLGFPGAGGVREGALVRYRVAGRAMPTTLGEPDGSMSARLDELGLALAKAGFPVEIHPEIDAWLKTHVALISPIANAIYLAGGDNYRLAKTRDGVALFVRAVKEGLRALQAKEVPITPGQYQALLWIPEPILVAVMQRSLATEEAKLSMAGHANAARDEMKMLADEFRAFIKDAGVPTPAIDELYAYLNPEQPTVPEGSATLALDWRSIGIAAGVVGGVALLVGLLGRKR